MARNTDMPVAPPLPSGSVDFNALHEAARRGEKAERAVKKALLTEGGESISVLEVQQLPETKPVIQPVDGADKAKEKNDG